MEIPKILGVRVLMPVLVECEWPDGKKDEHIGYLDTRKSKVHFPNSPLNEDMQAAVIGWLNNTKTPDAMPPIEIAEAIERTRATDYYKRGEPYV